jgi:alpha-1,6-mannosyltransferase
VRTGQRSGRNPGGVLISFSRRAVEGVPVPGSSSLVLDRTGRYALLLGATVGELAILQAPRHAVGSVLLVLGTGSLVALLVVLERRRRCLRVIPVVLAIGVTMLAAVWTPPRTSNDLWSYTMYGRMVTVYDKSPYEHVPAEFRPDPFVHRVSPRWRHRASVYGPVFVGVSAVAALVAGPSALAARLFFQLLAALALTATLVIVWRTTRDLAALIFLGLNPVLVVIVVNGGHSDMLIGLALLLATLVAVRRRPRTAGALIGIAVLIKLTAGLAIIGLVLWAWRHQLTRFARTLVLTAAGVVLAGYFAVFASASRVLGDADKTVTNGSPWNWIIDRLLHHDAWRNVPMPLAPNRTLAAFFFVGAVTVLTLALTFAHFAGRRERPDPAVAVAVAAYPIGAEYAYPWYTAWSLPVFASDGLSSLSGVVGLQSVLMLAALKLPIAVRGSALQAALRLLLTDVAPPAVLVAFVAVALHQYSTVVWRRGGQRPWGLAR